MKKVGKIWPKNDLTWLEIAFRFAPSKKNQKIIYNLIFSSETFKPLLEEMSLNSLRRWVNNFYFKPYLLDEEKQDLEKRLKTVDYKDWLSLQQEKGKKI